MAGANDPRYIEFVSRLRTMRQVRNLSQKTLGQRINKPQSFVSKVETCERRLDVIEAAEWCVALGVRLDDVLPVEVRNDLDAAARGA